MAYIYHLIPPKEWEQALNKDSYKTESLKTEGFIHFSTKEQVIGSATKHYPKEESLVLLAIHEKRVKQHLKWEPSRNEELFPHLYSKINMEWIDTTFLLSKNGDGEWEWER